MTIRPDAGRLVWKARERAGLSQRDLCARMHTGQSWLSRLEAGKLAPSAGSLALAALALGVEPSRVGLDVPLSSNDDRLASDLPPLAPSGKTIALTIDSASPGSTAGTEMIDREIVVDCLFLTLALVGLAGPWVQPRLPAWLQGVLDDLMPRQTPDDTEPGRPWWRS